MLANFQIVGAFNKEISATIDAQDTVNAYAIIDDTGKNKSILVQYAGTNLSRTLDETTNNVRLTLEYNNFSYVCIGDIIYKLNPDLTEEDTFAIGSLTGNVFAPVNNAQQILFVDGDKGYIYNTVTEVFAEITDPNFPANPTCATFLDGFFIVTAAGSNAFYLSAINNGLVWGKFQTANYGQGFLIGCAVCNSRLFLFKETTLSVWYNAGAAGFPFRQDNNSKYDFGCAALGSIREVQGNLMWLSKVTSGSGAIMLSENGSAPRAVSTAAVDRLIRGITTPSDAQSYFWNNEGGKLFYITNFTVDDLTLGYQVEYGFWFRLKEQAYPTPLDPIGGKTRHIGNTHMYFNNKHYIGSYNSPVLYELSENYADNHGEPMVIERVMQNLFDPTFKMVQFNRFQVDMQTGIGNQSGIYQNPKIYLSLSIDGGITFGNEMEAPLGRVGQRYYQVYWRQLGYERNFVPKLTVYASVKRIIMMGGVIDYEVIDR